MNRPLRTPEGSPAGPIRRSLRQLLRDALPAFTLFMLASSPLLGRAQIGAPVLAAPQPASAASSSVAPINPGGKPGPRLLSLTEKRDSEAQPEDLKTDRPVTPQISIPFGKNPPPASKADPRAARRAPAAPSVGVDDRAARCEAEADDATRAICRDKQAKMKRTTPI